MYLDTACTYRSTYYLVWAQEQDRTESIEGRYIQEDGSFCKNTVHAFQGASGYVVMCQKLEMSKSPGGISTSVGVGKVPKNAEMCQILAIFSVLQ